MQKNIDKVVEVEEDALNLISETIKTIRDKTCSEDDRKIALITLDKTAAVLDRLEKPLYRNDDAKINESKLEIEKGKNESSHELETRKFELDEKRFTLDKESSVKSFWERHGDAIKTAASLTKDVLLAGATGLLYYKCFVTGLKYEEDGVISSRFVSNHVNKMPKL